MIYKTRQIGHLVMLFSNMENVMIESIKCLRTFGIYFVDMAAFLTQSFTKLGKCFMFSQALHAFHVLLTKVVKRAFPRWQDLKGLS
jgi:hypothetical protein